jgi:hypothetical protein
MKAKKGIKKWAQKAWKDVKNDPEVISRTLDRAEKRVRSVAAKGQDAYGKAQSGDYLGAAKAGFNTYKAAVGAKKHKQLIDTNKAYRRTVNVGGKTFKAAESFQAGDNESGYKQAMIAARAAIGKAKLEQIKSHKATKEALAIVHGLNKARGAKGGSNIDKLEAGISGYTDKKAQQKAKIGGQGVRPLLGA